LREAYEHVGAFIMGRRMFDETALGRQEDWEEPKGRAVVARGAVPDFSS
jgi:hypothetical protein